mgnify:CR=1 FL=1
MKKDMNNNKFISIKNIYFLGLILVALILITTSFTYALFTTSSIKKNAVNIKTGSLGLTVKCDDFNESNQVTVDANSEKNITITVSNPNEIPVKYNLYYQSSKNLDDIELGYITSSDKSPDKNGEVLSKQGEGGDTKKIKINIKNNSDTSLTLTIGTSVGLSNKTLAFPEGKSIFTESSKKFVCKRAVNLHTEECSYTDPTSNCSGAGYTVDGSKGTTTITYGNLGVVNTLTSGDAFDCDINGDEAFDEATERFYYVTDLDSDTATLIYYNNTSKEVADNTPAGLTAYYATADENWHGPVNAITKLPTTTQWKTTLTNTKRAITTETGTSLTTGGTLPTDFSYEGYAARLITYQEVKVACGYIDTSQIGALDNCEYLIENTKFSSDNNGNYGYWLETPTSSDATNAWYIKGHGGSNRNIANRTTSGNTSLGVRPVIEVKKADIDYK